MSAMPTTSMQVDLLLKRNQLSITEARKKILSLFLHEPGALAHAAIEKKTGEKIDRVTVYRTLQSFLEKGIIHAIPTSDNSIQYALCKDDCSQGHHHDNHVHFICSECRKTICMEGVDIPSVRLPSGFQPTEWQMIIKGICKDCL